MRITVNRLVPHLAGTAQYDDFLSVGTLALIRSVDHFDPTRETKFESYAIANIRMAILEQMRRDDWVPRVTRDKVRAMDRVELVLEVRLGRVPSLDEVAAELGITLEEVCRLKGIRHRAFVRSLDEPTLAEGDEAGSIADLVPDEGVEGRRIADAHSERTLLAECVGKLPVRMRSVVGMHYFDGLSFGEIARALGVSESRAYQLHAQAIARLKELYRSASLVPA